MDISQILDGPLTTDAICLGFVLQFYFYHASVVALWSTLILGMYFANQIKMLLDVYKKFLFDSPQFVNI